MVCQDKLKDAHSIDMDGDFEQWEVEGAQASLPSFSSRTVCISHWVDEILLRPLFFNALKYLARNLIQEDTRKEFTAKLLILDNMERLLEYVEAERDGKLGS